MRPDEALHRCRPGCPCGGWDGTETGEEPPLEEDDLPDRVAQRVADVQRRKAGRQAVRAELGELRRHGLRARRQAKLSRPDPRAAA
jgi:hypothetical protein